MAVTRTSAGTMVSGAGAITATFGAGAAAGNLGLLIVTTANQAVSNPSGWSSIGINSFGTAGAAGGCGIQTMYKASITSGDISGGIAIADGGDFQAAVLMTFSGFESAAPYVFSYFNSSSTATTSVNLSNSTGNNVNVTARDIVIAAIVTDRDSATVSTNTSAAWANVTGSNSFPVNGSTATNTGGGIIVNELVPSASQTGNVTFTCSITSSAYYGHVIVIKAPLTGTLAKTLGSVTLTSASTVTNANINGTLAKTLSALTVTTASQLAIKATLAKTLANVSTTAVGKLAISATLSKTLASIITAETGQLALKAQLVKTLNSTTVVSVGKLSINGVLVKTLSPVLANSLAFFPRFGSFNRSLDSVTLRTNTTLFATSLRRHPPYGEAANAYKSRKFARSGRTSYSK